MLIVYDVTVYVTHQRVVDSQGEVHERINVLWLHNHVPAEVSQQCQNYIQPGAKSKLGRLEHKICKLVFNFTKITSIFHLETISL